MTTAADDPADEAAFEAFLAGRPVPEEAAGLAAFASAIRATATEPGRPNAVLADLLATGLLVDQSRPSTRTAPSAGSSPRRPRVRRRRFAMFFPALLAKLLSAGAVAQAATGAGVVLVVATGAGATGLLGTDAQDTLSSAVGTDSAEVTPRGDLAVAGDGAADPGTVDGSQGQTTVTVTPTEEPFDPKAWTEAGPAEGETFGAWVSESVHKPELRDWLRSHGMTVGSMVRRWAHEKGYGDADLVEQGVDLDDLTEEPSTAPAPVTGDTAAGVDDQDADTEVATTRHGNGNGRGNSADADGTSAGSGNGKGRGHN